MTRLVLRGARWPGDVAVEGGRIAAVGAVAEESGDQVLRFDGDIVTAGLVNTHHHFYQWMTRGWAFDQTLFGWLTTLYPVWAKLTPEDVEAASAVAMGELALTGCTTAADHHYLVPGGDDSVFDAIASAARTVGIRAHIARGSMDLGQSRGGLPPDSVVEDLDAILASTKAVHDRLHDGDRIVVTVAPCSPFSVTPELMTASAELARDLGLRLHTHLAETLDEQRSCLERYGRRPLAYLDDLGDVLDPLAGLVLGPERHARHVLVDGDHVVRDGRLLGADMDALRQDLTRRARRLWPADRLAVP
jgi:cytosine/adenosine deaminase-related metal-dependent hydrolase